MARARKPLPSSSSTPTSKTAILYARVSTKEQEEGFSIDAQLGLLRGYALAKGYTVAEEIVEAETAKSTGRPGFNAMIARCRRTEVAAIVVEKTDRIYRNLKDRVTVDELGVELHLVKENTVISRDSRSHEKFVHDIKVVVAKNYCDNLSEEARKGMREKARQGFYPSMAPLGYRNVNANGRKIVEPDPDTAPIVRRLFETYAAGDLSLRAAVPWVAAHGLTSRRGGTIRPCTLQWILRNPFYYGRIQWNGEEFDGSHAPLISKQTFDLVQDVMAGRNNTKVSNAQVPVAYRSLFKCGVCGCNMSAYVIKAKYVYYACTGARGCRRAPIREEILTAAIGEKLEGLTLRPEVLDAMRLALEEMHHEQTRDQDEAAGMLEARKAELHRLRRQAYLDHVAKKLAEDIYLDLVGKWDAELIDVDRLLTNLVVAERHHHRDNLSLLNLCADAAWLFSQANPDERRELLKRLLANSTVTAGKVDVQLQNWLERVFETNKKTHGNPQKADWWALLVQLQRAA